MKLAILLYGLEEDNEVLKKTMLTLQAQLNRLKKDRQAEVLYYVDNGELSLEEKRDWLLGQTTSTKYCFIDKYTVIDDFFILKRLNLINQGKKSEELIKLDIYSKINKLPEL